MGRSPTTKPSETRLVTHHHLHDLKFGIEVEERSQLSRFPNARTTYLADGRWNGGTNRPNQKGPSPGQVRVLDGTQPSYDRSEASRGLYPIFTSSFSTLNEIPRRSALSMQN